MRFDLYSESFQVSEFERSEKLLTWKVISSERDNRTLHDIMLGRFWRALLKADDRVIPKFSCKNIFTLTQVSLTYFISRT